MPFSANRQFQQPSAATMMRGSCWNWRLALNGIQCAFKFSWLAGVDVAFMMLTFTKDDVDENAGCSNALFVCACSRLFVRAFGTILMPHKCLELERIQIALPVP